MKKQFENKKGFFILESPLQIMCAYEAIKAFQLKQVRIITRLADVGRNNEQMSFLIDTFLTDYEVKRIYVKPQSRSLKSIFISIILSIYVLFLYFQNYNIYIGHYKSVFARILTFFLKSNRKIYLDDGAASLNYPKSLLLSNSYFFSIFNLKTPFFVKNNFIYLSRFLFKLNTDRENIVLFIGVPIRQIANEITGDYFDVIKKVKEKYSLHFVYFPHRRELKEDLDRVRSLGVQVMNNKYPVEMFYFEFSNYHPAVVASITSTAMFTMNMIYNSKIVLCDGVIKENISNLVNVFNAISKIEDIDIVEC